MARGFPVKVKITSDQAALDQVRDKWLGMFKSLAAEANKLFKIPSGQASRTSQSQPSRTPQPGYLQDIKRIEKEREKIMSDNAKAIEKLSKQEADSKIREGKRASTALIQELNKTRQASEQAAKQSGGLFGQIFGANLAANLTSRVVSGVTNFLTEGSRAVLDFSANLENAKIGFETMLKSAALADQHIGELKIFAKKTPFAFDELVTASQRMQALGFTATEVVPTLSAVGDAIAASGTISQERLERVIKALGDVRAKGKLETQEIRQFAENGIPAWKILETQLGKSRVELVKLVEAGEISSVVFDEAFKRFTQQNFGGVMEKQSRTFQGALRNISDSLLITASEDFQPLFKSISEISVRMSDEVAKSKSVGEQLSAVIKGASEVVGAAISAAAYGLGKLYADQFVKAFTAEDIGSRLRAASNVATLGIAGVLLDVGKGLVEGSGLYEFESTAIAKREASIKSLIPVLQQAAREEREKNKTVSESIIQLDNLKKSQADAEKQTKAINDIYRSTARAFVDFGENSRQAAVTQQLLASGIANVNEGLAKQTIEVAKATDALNSYLRNTKETYEERGATAVQVLNDLNNTAIQFRKSTNDLKNTGLDEFTKRIQEAQEAYDDLQRRFNRLPESDRGNESIARQIFSLTKNFTDLTKALNDAKNKASLKSVGDFSKTVTEGLATINQEYLKLSIGKGKETPIDRLVKDIESLNSAIGKDGIGNRIDTSALKELFALISGKGFNYLDKKSVYDLAAKSLDDLALRNGNLYAQKEAIIQIIQSVVLLTEQERELTRSEQERNGLLDERKELLDRINNDTNAQYRIETGYLQNILDLRRQEESAIISSHRSMLELSQQTAYSATQANASVLQFLANTKGVTAIVADAKIGVIQTTFDLADRGLSKLTEKLGIFGSLIKSILSDLIRLALSKVFQQILNLNNGSQSGNQQSSGIGGFFGSILNALGLGRSGQRTSNSASANAHAGNVGATTPGNLSNSFTQAARSVGIGGITAPESIGGHFQADEIQHVARRGNQVGSAAGSISGKFNFGQFLGGLAPGLGASFGALAGGQSVGGQILGSIGGLLGGLVVAASTGAIGGSLGGAFALSGALGPAALIAAPLLILGAILLGRKKQRKKDETQRDTIFGDAITQMRTILSDVSAIPERMDGEEGKSRATTIFSEWEKGVSQIKTRSVRNSAIQNQKPVLLSLQNQISAAADAQAGRKTLSDKLTPEFAGGFYIPGTFDGRDDILAFLSRGEMVLNPTQQKKIKQKVGFDPFAYADIPNYKPAKGTPRFETGAFISATPGSFAATPDINITQVYEIRISEAEFTDIVLKAAESDAGKRVTYKVIKKAQSEGDI